MTPELSVVVPAYNSWWLTKRCLDAVRALDGACGVSFETIVVDNASADETPARLTELDGIRTLRLDPNAKFGGAANAGAAAARAPIVLFLNNDAWPIGDALTPLAAAFDDASVAIAGAALFWEDGVTQGAGSVLLPNAHWFLSHRNLPADVPFVRTSRDCVVVPGAAFAVRTRWFLESGGFDSVFRNGFEDADLCMRAHAAGLRTRYVADARFAHEEAATPDRFDFEQENERIFYRRWQGALAAIPRVDRGELGALIVHDGSSGGAGAAALADLLAGVRSYGHPVARTVAPWQRFDRRFRAAAHLAWNCDGAPYAPSVEVFVDGGVARMRTHGAVRVEVPWMPCADPARPHPVDEGGDPYGYAALCTAYAGTSGAAAAADARRRGAPRRSAMRVLDLARVARCGFERPGRATANAPLRVA